MISEISVNRASTVTRCKGYRVASREARGSFSGRDGGTTPSSREHLPDVGWRDMDVYVRHTRARLPPYHLAHDLVRHTCHVELRDSCMPVVVKS